MSLSKTFLISFKSFLTIFIKISLKEWNQPNINRIGFERVEVEWARNDFFTNSSVSRISFVVNGNQIVYPNDKYIWKQG